MSISVRTDHLKLIAISHIRNSLRSGAGVIFLVLSMLAGLALAGAAVAPIEAIAQQSKNGMGEAALRAAINEYGPGLLSRVADVSDEQARFLLSERPALISLFLILLTVALPYLAALSGFNQTSGDIGSKGLRYLLLRTERANVFLGRLIGTYLFTLAVITVIIAIVTVYVVAKVRFDDPGAVITWALRGWLAAAIFVMPWIALSAWVSAAIDMPFLSLLISGFGLFVWVIAVLVIKMRVDEAGYAAYVTPWGFKWWLLHSNPAVMLGGVGVMLGFTGAFTYLGLRTFNRRDL